MLRFFFISLFILSVAARGEVLTLRQAIQTACDKNPDLRSLQAQTESAEAKARQAISPAEPTLSLSYNDSGSLFNLGGAASTAYSLTQPLGFPGKAFVNQSALNDQAKSMSHQVRSKRLSVVNTIRSAYYNLALGRKNLEINVDQKRSYERILEIAKRRYESGAITQVDLMIAQSSFYSNLNDLADLLASERATRAQLNLMLGNPPEEELDIDPLKPERLPPFDRELTTQKMIDHQPEIQASVYGHRAAEKAYKLAWMGLLPDFQFTIGTTYYNFPGASPYSGAADPLTHTYMASVQLTIPIWGLFNERENIQSAAKDRAAAEAKLDSQYLQSKITFESTLQTLNSIETKLKNYEVHLLPLADQTLQLALTNYSSGKIDFQTLSDTANAWRTTKTTYYALLVNYLTTYYSVGQLTGEDFLDET